METCVLLHLLYTDVPDFISYQARGFGDVQQQTFFCDICKVECASAQVCSIITGALSVDTSSVSW